MDPFGMTPEQYTAGAAWVAAIAALATLVVVALTARYAAEQINEAKATRLDQSRPYIVVSIVLEQQHIFMLSVENVGKTPARNVRVQFREQPRSTLKDIEDVRMLKEPIPTMPPGQKFRAYWEPSFQVFSESKPYPHPLTYRVDVAYEDHHGHSFGPEEYVLDFRVWEGQAAGPRGLPELIAEVAKIAKEHRKWTGGVHGLQVNVIDALKKERRDFRPVRFRKIKDAYERDGLKGAASYWIDQWRRRYGLWSR